MLKRMCGILSVMLPVPAVAHEGHGHIEAASIWHWLLEYEHTGWLLPALLVLIVIYWKKGT